MTGKQTAGGIAGLIALLAAVFASMHYSSQPTTPTTPPASDSTPVVVAPPVTTPPTSPPATGGTSTLSSVREDGDDFTEYANTAALQAKITKNIGGTCASACIYTDGVGPQLASIDTVIKYNGHQTMRYTQGPGTPNTAELWAGLPTPTKNLWFRVKLRFSPGWTDVGSTPNDANAYKLLGMAWDTYDGSLRLELSNTNQYQLYWGPTTKSSGAALVTVVYGDMKNTTTEWTDGAWYDYIINLDFTQPQGVARVWRAKDGATPVLTGTSATSMLSASNPWPNINQAMLGLNMNQALLKTQSLNYGQWEAIDGVAHPNPYGL